MKSLALVLSLALTAPVDAPPATAQAGAAVEGGAVEGGAVEGGAVEGAAVEGAAAVASAQRVWGVSLMAGGSALLAVTATGTALIEALTRPDDADEQIANPALVQSVTFGAMVLGATSLAAMLAGAALSLAE